MQVVTPIDAVSDGPLLIPAATAACAFEHLPRRWAERQKAHVPASVVDGHRHAGSERTRSEPAPTSGFQKERRDGQAPVVHAANHISNVDRERG